MKSKMFLMGKLIVVVLVPALFMSCATIVGKSSPEMVNIRTAPDQASVVVTDEDGVKIFEGKTPTIITLEKKRGYFSGKTYNVSITKEGFSNQTVTVNTRLGGWYLGGNLIFGGLIGWLIVDPASGAMWTLDTNEIDITLQAAQQTQFLQPNTSAIVLLQDVPEALQNKMVRVAQ